MSDAEYMLELARRQAAASQALLASKSTSAMAAALAQAMLRGPGMAVSLNQVNIDRERGVLVLRALALALMDVTYEGGDSIEVPLAGWLVDLSDATLEQMLNRPMLVDVEEHPALDAGYRDWLRQLGIRRMAVFPVTFQGSVIGGVTINDLTGQLELDEAEALLFQSLADQVGALMQVNVLATRSALGRDLLERQRRAFEALHAGMTYTDMALVMAQAMLPIRGTFLGVSRLVYDTQDQVTGWQILATANRERGLTWETAPIMSWSGISPRLQAAVEAGEPYIIASLKQQAPEDVNDELDLILSANDVESFLNIPLRVDGRTVAALFVCSRRPMLFGLDEINAFRTLGDQVATLLQARVLLDEAVAAQQMAEQLISANRTIVQAVDDNALGAAVMTAMPPMVKATALLLFEHPLRMGEPPRALEGMVVHRGGRSLRLTNDRLAADAPVMHKLLTALFEGQPLTTPCVDGLAALPPATLTALHDAGSAFAIAFGLHNGHELMGVLALGATQPVTHVQHEQILRSVASQVTVTLENRALLRQTQATASALQVQVTTLGRLNRLVAALSAANNEQTLMDTAAQGLVELLNVDRCGILLLNADRSIGRLVSEYPVAGNLGIELETDENTLGPAIQTGDPAPIAISDLNNDPRVRSATREVLQSIGIASLMIVPLVVRGYTIGSVGLDVIGQSRTFAEDELSLARTVCAQLAIGLENLRLLAETQKRAGQFQRIALFSQTTQANFDPEAAVRALLREGAGMLPHDQIAISLYDSAAQELRVVGRRTGSAITLSLRDGDLIPLTGQLARAWSSRETVYIPNLASVSGELGYGTSVRSLLLVPVMARAQVRGMVTVTYSQASAFGEPDVALFSQLVNLFALALESATAYRRSERSARNEALVNDIASQLQQQLEIGRMLEITATELGKALGARQARIRLGTQTTDDTAGEEW